MPEADAFASFASAVGAGRALRLWRAHAVSDGAGGLTVERTGEADHAPFSVHGPAGLPDQLEVWLIHADGTETDSKPYFNFLVRQGLVVVQNNDFLVSNFGREFLAWLVQMGISEEKPL